jgi:hypothetical protein
MCGSHEYSIFAGSSDKILTFALSSQIIDLAVTLVHHYLIRHCFAELTEVARLDRESFLALGKLE